MNDSPPKLLSAKDTYYFLSPMSHCHLLPRCAFLAGRLSAFACEKNPSVPTTFFLRSPSSFVLTVASGPTSQLHTCLAERKVGPVLI